MDNFTKCLKETVEFVDSYNSKGSALNRINGKKLEFGNREQIAWIKKQEEKSKTCASCDGNKTIICNHCDGEGEVQCTNCL